MEKEESFLQFNHAFFSCYRTYNTYYPSSVTIKCMYRKSNGGLQSDMDLNRSATNQLLAFVVNNTRGKEVRLSIDFRKKTIFFKGQVLYAHASISLIQ
jgi:hypothetical protein